MHDCLQGSKCTGCNGCHLAYVLLGQFVTHCTGAHTYVRMYIRMYVYMYVHHLNVCTRTIRCRGQSGYVQTRGTLCIFDPILARCHPIHFDFGSSCPLGEERQLTLKVVNLSGIASSFHAHVVHLPAATSPAPPDKPKPSKGCTHRSV